MLPSPRTYSRRHTAVIALAVLVMMTQGIVHAGGTGDDATVMAITVTLLQQQLLVPLHESPSCAGCGLPAPCAWSRDHYAITQHGVIGRQLSLCYPLCNRAKMSFSSSLVAPAGLGLLPPSTASESKRDLLPRPVARRAARRSCFSCCSMRHMVRHTSTSTSSARRESARDTP